MSKVITFSRTFPSYHPRKGEPTYFVEKILNALGVYYISGAYYRKLLTLNRVNIYNGKLTIDDIIEFQNSLININSKKPHTIRQGMRFNKKELFSPRCWWGKSKNGKLNVPYNSPQIIFWDDIEIKKIWNFEIEKSSYFISNYRQKVKEIILPKKELNLDQLYEIACNDGLTVDDFELWFQFPKPFKGQIICWNENINY